MVRIVTLIIAVAAQVLSTNSVWADAATSPKIEMQTTVNEIVRIAAIYPEESQKAERRAKLRAVINPKFNFSEMAKRSLGANWNDISIEEQQDFTTVFSELLARTYLSKIETVKPGMVKVESESVELSRASVKTSVISKGDTFPIEYRLSFQDGRWQVYDVVIENIGLVANYRNEFSGIIRKSKFSGLMEKLRAKVG